MSKQQNILSLLDNVLGLLIDILNNYKQIAIL